MRQSHLIAVEWPAFSINISKISWKIQVNQLKDFKLMGVQKASESGEMHKSQYFSIPATTGKQT